MAIAAALLALLLPALAAGAGDNFGNNFDSAGVSNATSAEIGAAKAFDWKVGLAIFATLFSCLFVLLLRVLVQSCGAEPYEESETARTEREVFELLPKPNLHAAEGEVVRSSRTVSLLCFLSSFVVLGVYAVVHFLKG